MYIKKFNDFVKESINYDAILMMLNSPNMDSQRLAIDLVQNMDLDVEKIAEAALKDVEIKLPPIKLDRFGNFKKATINKEIGKDFIVPLYDNWQIGFDIDIQSDPNEKGKYFNLSGADIIEKEIINNTINSVKLYNYYAPDIDNNKSKTLSEIKKDLKQEVKKINKFIKNDLKDHIVSYLQIFVLSI